MPSRFRGPRRAVVVLLLVAGLAACGGGGGGSSDPGALSQLQYTSPSASYRLGEAIAPNVPAYEGNVVTTWSITPSLPPGLTFDAATGTIVGVAQSALPYTTYEVTATNDVGTAVTSVSFEIRSFEADSLEPIEGYSEADIRHFLERTHFGYSAQAHQRINAIGMVAYLDEMTTLAEREDLEDDARDAHLRDQNDPQGEHPSHRDLARWWLYLMQETNHPFQEVIALHWHDRFAASSDVLGGSSRWWYVAHVNLFRLQGAGNLRTLLLDMSRDWTMLEWLDGIRNNGAPGEEPNENFAREFFELFTIGVDNGYTETDIVEAARAFTGYKRVWDGDRHRVEFDPARHDATNKFVLGQTIPGQSATDDYAAVVDLTLALSDPATGQSRCGRYIVRSLLERFLRPDPPAALVNGLTQLLQNSNWELKPVLTTLFRSEAFYHEDARGSLIKSPTEFALGFIRATGLKARIDKLDSRLDALGHRPTQPPDVAGWDEGDAWFSSQGMVDRSNLIQYLITDRNAQAERGIDVADLLPSPFATAAEVVDSLAERLGVTLSTADRTRLVTYLDTRALSEGASEVDPFDATNETHLDERVRGLLYILAHHPTYSLK